jgi:hypothetical protein
LSVYIKLGAEGSPVDRVEKSDVRPVFRRLAGGVGIVCLALAALLAFVPIGGDVRAADTRGASYACAVLGIIMTGIGLTGLWPWWGRRQP